MDAIDAEFSYKDSQGFSQDCIEWDESKNIDLRQLARSPHMPMTPALLATQLPTSAEISLGRIRRRLDTSSSSSAAKEDIVTRLDGAYNPEREVDGLFHVLHKDQATVSLPIEPCASTQRQGNLVRTATFPPALLTSQGRRRKRRESNDLQRDLVKRIPRPIAAGRVRRRPQSADSGAVPATRTPRRADANLTQQTHELDLETLLKELDEPKTRYLAQSQSVPSAHVDSGAESTLTKSQARLVHPAEVIPSRNHLSTASSAQGARAPYSTATANGTNIAPALTIPQTNDTSVRMQSASCAPVASVGTVPLSNLVEKNQIPDQSSLQLKSSSKLSNRDLTRHQIPNSDQTGSSHFPLAPVAESHFPQSASSSHIHHSPISEQNPCNPNGIAISGFHDNAQIAAHLTRNPTPARCNPYASSSMMNSTITSKMAKEIKDLDPVQINLIPPTTAGPDDFGDDMLFSVADLAALDAIMTQTIDSSRNICKDTSSLIGISSDRFSSGANSIDIEIVAQANCHAAQTEKFSREQQTPQTLNSDEFDDFPVLNMDFDALDKQIAARESLDVTKHQECVPPKSTYSMITLPPLDAAVKNQVVAGFDPHYAFIGFSRYKVVRVNDDTASYTKTLEVRGWESSMHQEESETSIHRSSSVRRSGSTTDPGVHAVTGDGFIFLRGEWYHTHVDGGDFVHLCSLSGKYRTDKGGLPIVLHSNPPKGSNLDDDLLIIVHPDMLIPPTIISETVSCSRRAVIRSRLGSSGLTSKAALFGILRHELFGRCMSDQDFSLEASKLTVHRIARKHAESLVGCGIKDAEAQKEVIKVLPELQRFATEFTAFHLSPRSIHQRGPTSLSGKNGSILEGNGVQPDLNFVANTVHATEEALVCPELGLKGNIDVTVTATTSFAKSIIPHGTAFDGREQTSLMSVELKTGHNQNPQHAHMAQLAFYIIMLRTRYGPSNQHPTSHPTANDGEYIGAGSSGMLLYLNDDSYRALHVSPMLNEIKSLIGQRNVVASELRRVSRPRGVVLNYDNDDLVNRPKDGNGSPVSSIQLLPAPPAALPEVLASSHSCTRCYSNRECMMYASAELRSFPSSSVQKSHSALLHHFTGHLNDEDINYFREWDRLIDLEIDASTYMTTHSWLLSSKEQEQTSGKCMSSLVLDEVASDAMNCLFSEDVSDKPTVFIVLQRSDVSPITTPLARLNIESGSYVIVSSDATSFDMSSHQTKPANDKIHGHPRFRHQMNIVRGVVEKVDERRVTIRASQEELSHLRRIVQRYRRACGAHLATDPSQGDGSLLLRLDKDEISTGCGTLRQNLIKLFTADTPPFDIKQQPPQDPNLISPKQSNPLPQRLSWLRDMIIRLRCPSFDVTLSRSMFSPLNVNNPHSLSCPKPDFYSLAAEFSELNQDQRKAVEKVICAKDYTLIQGLPGTGKTSTIAFVARLLSAHGKRVLITSYTHAAVDNLMMKLMEKGMASTTKMNPYSRLVRVGRKSECHPGVQAVLVQSLATSWENSERFKQSSKDHMQPSADTMCSVLSGAQIIGVSALTLPRSSLLVGQHFDVVIVDEAGQISQPAILGVLMAADSFVLVGDHMQLPPLVNSEAAERGGYGISMLKRLADKYPESVAQLTLQYRMHGSICQLCNDIVYGGKLRCANPDVESSLLELPLLPTDRIQELDWLSRVVNPNRPVVFVDTDSINDSKGPEEPRNGESLHTPIVGLERSLGTRGKGNIVNDTEASLVQHIIHRLITCGVAADSIGVICPFRSQLRLLDQTPCIQDLKSSGLEVSTIDRYQGRDKPVIILSFVRSNTKGNSGRLLDDFRRLNVAVSRAKHKLIMMGSYSTLHRGSEVLRPVLEKVRHRHQVEILPDNALHVN